MAEHRRYGFIIRLLIIGGVFTAWLRGLYVYDAEAEERIRHFAAAGAQAPGYVKVDMWFVSFDPTRGDLLTRFEFEPKGTLDQYGSITENLVVYTSASSGKTETMFKKGETMAPVEVIYTIDSADGADFAHYPNDRYEDSTQLVIGIPQPDGSLNGVPMVVNCEITVPGFHIHVEEVPTAKTGNLLLNLTVTRNASSRFFANFVMGLMLVIAFVAGCVVYSFWRDGRTPDLPLFQWMATLLFAMPPLRNAMPGAPGIGARADYVSFFWAEAAIAIEMIALVTLWLMRRPRS